MSAIAGMFCKLPRSRWPCTVTAAIGLVLAAGVANVVLIVNMLVDYAGEMGFGLEDVLPALFLLVIVMVPVAVMSVVVLVVARRPNSTAVARWSLVAGAVTFLVLNVVLNWSTSTSDRSTAALGFLFSIPVLLGVAVLTAIPIAVSVRRRQ